MRNLKSEEQIIKSWRGELISPMVSISCLTFNHSKYIEDAIEGFLIQETDFPFEVLIHDDASLDDTAEIIKEYEIKYPNIIKPVYQKINQWTINRNIIRNAQYGRVRGKYIAICEGDDYWIDPLKLQKQIDFLENNPEYGLSYTGVKVLKDNKFIYSKSLALTENAFYELISKNSISTLTTCCRKELFLRYFDEVNIYNKDWVMGDYPLWLFLSYNSKVHYLDNITSVYRKRNGTISHPEKKSDYLVYIRSGYDIITFFLEKYGLRDDIKYRKLLVKKARCNLKISVIHSWKELYDFCVGVILANGGRITIIEIIYKLLILIPFPYHKILKIKKL